MTTMTDLQFRLSTFPHTNRGPAIAAPACYDTRVCLTFLPGDNGLGALNSTGVTSLCKIY